MFGGVGYSQSKPSPAAQFYAWCCVHLPRKHMSVCTNLAHSDHALLELTSLNPFQLLFLTHHMKPSPGGSICAWCKLPPTIPSLKQPPSTLSNCFFWLITWNWAPVAWFVPGANCLFSCKHVSTCTTPAHFNHTLLESAFPHPLRLLFLTYHTKPSPGSPVLFVYI